MSTHGYLWLGYAVGLGLLAVFAITLWRSTRAASKGESTEQEGKSGERDAGGEEL